MAYRLSNDERIEAGEKLFEYPLQCYDWIFKPDDDEDIAELLAERSSLEFIRDRLTNTQIAELNKVDAFWRAHPKEFNTAFAADHFRVDRKTVLEGFVEDEKGNVPAIPRSHWWWWPIPIEKEGKKGR